MKTLGPKARRKILVGGGASFFFFGRGGEKRLSGEKRKWAFFHFFRTLSHTLSSRIPPPFFLTPRERTRSRRQNREQQDGKQQQQKTIFSSPFRRSGTACTAARTRAARRSHECPPWPWACARPRRSATGSQAGQARGRRRGLRLEGFLCGERDREREGGDEFFRLSSERDGGWWCWLLVPLCQRLSLRSRALSLCRNDVRARLERRQRKKRERRERRARSERVSTVQDLSTSTATSTSTSASSAASKLFLSPLAVNVPKSVALPRQRLPRDDQKSGA